VDGSLVVRGKSVDDGQVQVVVAYIFIGDVRRLSGIGNDGVRLWIGVGRWLMMAC
jgi:hypothetical protein